jgi:hypothetical protein
MAGKPPVFADLALYWTLDDLTKNQLIDLAVDLATAEVGEDASNDAIVAWLQPRMDTVWSHRKDKAIPLKAKLAHYVQAAAKIREQREQREAAKAEGRTP